MSSHASAPEASAPLQRVSSRTVVLAALAALLDLALVAGFTAIGRGSHAREATLAGLAETAWPFVLGLAISWLLLRAWRAPRAVVRTGIPVWIGTAALGLIIRVLATDSTAAVPFIIVTLVTLALFLLGWRLIALLVLRLRGSR